MWPARIAAAAASSISAGPSSSGNPWPRLIDPVRSARADISVKIVVPKPARREETTGGRLRGVSHTGLRERLRRREPLTAAFLDLGSPVSAEVTAASGFDVVVVDLEHGAGDEAAARAQIVAAGPHAAVVVRCPAGRGRSAGCSMRAPTA